MSLILRPYQSKIIEDARDLMKRGCKRFLIVSPTGSGKTALTTQMLLNAKQKGFNSQFLVHRRELIKQSSEAFAKADVQHGIIASGFFEEYHKQIQIASVQTLGRRLHKVPHPKFVVYDEAHHISAGTWDKIYKHYPNAFHVGLTATPCRLDGKGLNKHFDEIVMGPETEWLIENKYLSPYKLFAPSSINRQAMRKQMGDFKTTDSEALVDKKSITGSAIDEYLKVCAGKRAIVFCTTIKHSKHVVEQFRSKGINAVHLDAETPMADRDRTLNEFKAGQIKILSNVNLFSEGFDVPGLDAVILLRPTMSLGMYKQQVGRVLRISPGKECAYILDHVGNVLEHGLPDEVIEWSLDGMKRGKKQGDEDDGPAVVTCDNCFLAMPAHFFKCPECGHMRKKQVRAEIEQVAGKLKEVDKVALRKQRMREQAACETQDDLVEYGKQRGMKHPRGWAAHIWRARQVKKLKGGGRR